MNEFEQIADYLIDAGHQLYQWGMVPATSGNFSGRLSNGNLAITVSGAHKGKLTRNDIMLVDAAGQSLDGRKSSAETLLHVGIYQRYPNTGIVLHPHSVNATVLSLRSKTDLILRDYELLKAFPGVDTHDCSVRVPLVDNSQNIAELAAAVDHYFQQPDAVHGYLIRGHGFYTWGENIQDALRHVEAFEFLFECELKMQKVSS